MKVSVCMITFNHEKYIAEAIESALMQETYFNYELVIGEDCSTDRTRDIVLEYQRRFPDKIRVLLSQQNIGLTRNFAQTLKACKGHYVALIDGDDYWSSPYKLQLQADALDAHTDSAICFHAVQYIYEGEEQRLNALYHYGSKKGFLVLDDLLARNSIPTASVMLRAGWVGEIPNWYYEMRMEDWPLYILVAQHGNLRYLDMPMSVHRLHPTGIWSAASVAQRARDSIALLQAINANLHLNHQQRNILRTAISHYRLHIAIDQFAQGQRVPALEELARAAAPNPLLFESEDLLFDAIIYARGHCPPAENEAFIQSLFGEFLPRTPAVARVHTRLRSWLYMREVFEGLKANDQSRVDAHLWQGIRRDPAWLKNRGVLSTLVRSIIRRGKSKVWAQGRVNPLP